MLDSIRVRLTLWYTVVLAFVLVFLAGFSYVLYGRSLQQRADSAIVELSSAFATTFAAELADDTGPEAPRTAAREAMTEHRFRGTVFALLDSNGSLLASSLDLPAPEDVRLHPANDFLTSTQFRDLASESNPDPALSPARGEASVPRRGAWSPRPAISPSLFCSLFILRRNYSETFDTRFIGRFLPHCFSPVSAAIFSPAKALPPSRPWPLKPGGSAPQICVIV